MIINKGTLAEQFCGQELLAYMDNYTEKKLYYWGDMDPQGFDILHMFRTRFPDTRSLFMNIDCYNQFKEYAHHAGNYTIRENLHLTNEEKELISMLGYKED